ncbi:pentatricopeptide repeat (PPR) superfamily protein [Tasmannia lanceolata]|uniref:pentatricopeptide repeat (PPR) superfamily protein n=1 Tax=Tasmannia lanceolata TaxID=3420 RepID=UPI0040640764
MLSLRTNTTYKNISSLQFTKTCHSSAFQPITNSSHHLLNLFLSNPISDIKSLIQSHALIITSGNSNNIFLAAKLISLYSSFNKPNLSTPVFNSTHLKDTFLWNSIIKSHFSNGNYQQSLKFYLQMRSSGAPLNHFTIPMVATACAELPSIEIGRNVHGIALKLNFFGGNSATGSSFLYMYAKCCKMDEAYRVFDQMPVRDVVAWTALIIGFVQNDDSEMGMNCLRKMHKSGEDGLRPNFRTIEGGLQACGNLVALLEGRCLHGFATKTGIGGCCFVRSALLSMYCKCGSTEEAFLAFLELPDKDIVSWTTIIGAYARKGGIAKCIELFRAMLFSEIEPDGIIICCLIMGFGDFANVNEGTAFHGMMLRKNFEFDSIVSSFLLAMYCKFGRLDVAEKLFNRMHTQNRECWNWMIFGYGKAGFETKCLELFTEMQFVGFESDSNSLVTVISSCSRLVAPLLGRSVHCYVIKFSIDDLSVVNSLVGMYGRCGNLNVAKRIFDRMHGDIVMWNTLVSAYAHSGHSSDALLLFDQMLLKGMEPNPATLVSVLSACSQLAALSLGTWIHNYIREKGLECNISLTTALVDMYAKCGQLGLSREIFESMPERDVISWNVMISGYGIHGKANDAMESFQQMEKLGVKPNGVTFLAVLSACVHAGMVEEGKCIFNKMRDYSVSPTLKHYACMVDLLGRSGNLCEAEIMILGMPVAPDSAVWGALLSACKIYNNLEMGERAAKQAFKLDPDNDGYYILLSNMYSSVGRWEEAEKVRGMMRKGGVRKIAGWSSVEFYGELCLFLVGDKSHPQSEAIYTILETLFKQMEEWGYVAESEYRICDGE